MRIKLEPFTHKGIRVLVGHFGTTAGNKPKLFTKNGQYIIRDSKEEMIKAIDISLATKAASQRKTK